MPSLLNTDKKICKIDDNQKRPLEYLGHDVLVNGVFPFLDEKEIKTLAKVSPRLKTYTQNPGVWHDLYFKTYGTHPLPFNIYNWPNAYRWRSEAQLYAWGETSNGRLGYELDDPTLPEDFKSPANERHKRGVCRPFPVKALSHISIVDVVMEGSWSAVLSSDGEIYANGRLHPSIQMEMLTSGEYAERLEDIFLSSNDQDYSKSPNTRHTTTSPKQLGDQENQNDDESIDIDYYYRITQNTSAKAKKLKVVSGEPIKFIALGSGGKTHLLALDDNHNIWAWDKFFDEIGTKLELEFDDSSFDIVKSKFQNQEEPAYNTFIYNISNRNLKILKLASGSHYCAALLEGIGLVVWYGIESLQQLPVTRREVRDWGKLGKTTTVHPVLVPNTEFGSDMTQEVVDFHAGFKFLIYVTREGKLYRISTDSRESILTVPREELSEFYSKLEEVIASKPKSPDDRFMAESQYNNNNEKPKFIKVKGGLYNFAAISNTDNVICSKMVTNGVYITNSLIPEAPEELQNSGCVSIAGGNFHFLALLKGGVMLSWGCELMGSGLLGHGRFKDGLSSLGATESSGNFFLAKPCKVDTPGKVLVIAAGGSQSAAIITTEDINDE